MIERIYGGPQPGILLAIWIQGKTENWEEGVKFFTPSNIEQQVGYFRYKEGHEFVPHKHLPYRRTTERTTEVLVICKGSLRFDLFLTNGDPVRSGVAEAGDILILIDGAHGFQATADLEMLEVKSGPFNPKFDKCPLFAPAAD